MDMDKKAELFYRAMAKACPEIRLRAWASRNELNGFAKSNNMTIPGFIWTQKGGRGQFVVPQDICDEFAMVSSNAMVQAQPEPIHNIPAPAVVVRAHVERPQAPPKAFVPDIDENYVLFGHYKDVDLVVNSKIFYPLYITGLSGNGKSTMVEQVCAKRKREMIRVNLNALSDEDQLIGSKTLIDGNVEIVEGPVIIAMRRGATLLIDEIDAGSANALLCLQAPLEGKPFYFKLKNEMIIPTQGFNIIATANTKGKGNDNGQFIGTNILNEAFLERFGATFEQEYPSQKIEKQIILNFMKTCNCVDDVFAETLAKWSDAIRRTYDAGGVDEIMSTRRIIHIVKAFSIFGNRQKAVELCCNRFDGQTKTAFIDMFKAVSPAEEVAPKASINPMTGAISPDADDWSDVMKTMMAAASTGTVPPGGQTLQSLINTIGNGNIASWNAPDTN